MTARKLSELVAKATRAPYELDLEDGFGAVLVAQPTTPQWRQACKADGIAEYFAVLGVNQGDADRASTVLAAVVFGIDSAIVADMRNYFQLGN